jgi:hypothetical protein
VGTKRGYLTTQHHYSCLENNAQNASDCTDFILFKYFFGGACSRTPLVSSLALQAHFRGFATACCFQGKIIMLLQARDVVEELTPPSWQHEQACSVCKVESLYAIHGICEGFCTGGP